MKIDLVEVQYEEKEILRNLLEKSYYEFSQYTDSGLNDLGLIGFKWLDVFWLEEGWCAYFIKVDNKLAGQVLVTNVCDTIYNNKYQIWDMFISISTEIVVLEHILWVKFLRGIRGNG